MFFEEVKGMKIDPNANIPTSLKVIAESIDPFDLNLNVTEIRFVKGHMMTGSFNGLCTNQMCTFSCTCICPSVRCPPKK